MMGIKTVIYSEPKFIRLPIPILTQMSITLKHAISLLSLSLFLVLLLLKSAAQEDGDDQSNSSKQEIPLLV